ncbi:MAG: hypothetical protein K2X37_01885 [Chitinophagaceae bacterium]|nr:hypothetical protein [Chitinophagaceae bacterium]
MKKRTGIILLGIYINSFAAENSTVGINIEGYNSKYSNIYVSSFDVSCSGHDDYKYTATIPSLDNADEIEITGPFVEDDRIDGCTIDNGEKAYFTLNNVVINFDYEDEYGVVASQQCIIPTNIGTDWEGGGHREFDKLRGDDDDATHECEGSPGFKFRVTSGGNIRGTMYSKGVITISN